MEFSIRRQLCSHLVEVDKVDIERLVSLARLQQILVLVRVLRRKDETDDNLDDVDADLIEGDVEQGASGKALQDSNGKQVTSARLK